MIPDLKTLVFVEILIDAVSLVAVAVLWKQHRRRYRGIGWWLLDMAVQTASGLLLILRGIVPDFFSIVVANVAIVVGRWLFLVGLQQFFGRPSKNLFNIGFLSVFFLAFTYWTFVVPNLSFRVGAMSVGLAAVTLQIAWFLLRRDTVHRHYSARLLGYLALAYVVTNAARLVAHALLPSESNDFFLSNKLVDSLSQMAYIATTSLLTVALALLVNQRLLADFHAQENTFAKTFDSAPYGIVLTRMRDHPVIEVNREFERMSGWRRDEMLGKTPAELHLWNTEDDQKSFLSAVAEKRPVRNLELEFRRKDGSPFIGVLSTEVVEIGGETCLISSVGDVTEQHRLADQLRMLASHDALTKLPNRRLFYDRFAVALANAQRNQGKLAVLSLDIDNFKEINDTCGHEIGDTALVETAQRLTQTLRSIDTVARFGGDEFVILLWEIGSTSDASEVALKLLEQFQTPFGTSNPVQTLHVSVGIALYPDHGADLETLLRKSDEALYAVKRQGKNHFKFA